MRLTPPRWCLLLLTLVVVSSCGKDATSSGSVTFNGSWAGSIGAGGSVSFTVTNSAVTAVSISGAINPGGCSASYAVPANIAIGADSAFSGSTANDPTLSASFSGKFSSTTAASGSMAATYKSGCSGTFFAFWSATKQ